MRPFLASASWSPTIWYLRLLFGVLVHQRDGGAEFHTGAGELRHVDHLGAADLVLKLHHAAFDEALAFLRGVIFGVLGEIAMRARFGDHLDDGGPLHGLEIIDLFFQGLVALGGHRNAFHGLSILTGKMTFPPALSLLAAGSDVIRVYLNFVTPGFFFFQARLLPTKL